MKQRNRVIFCVDGGYVVLAVAESEPLLYVLVDYEADARAGENDPRILEFALEDKKLFDAVLAGGKIVRRTRRSLKNVKALSGHLVIQLVTHDVRGAYCDAPVAFTFMAADEGRGGRIVIHPDISKADPGSSWPPECSDGKFMAAKVSKRMVKKILDGEEEAVAVNYDDY